MRSDSSARAVSMMIGMTGGLVVGAQEPADLEAVHVRQHQVEHDEVRRLRAHAVERVATRRHSLGRIAGLLEVADDELGDVGIVFDHEDAGGHRAHSIIATDRVAALVGGRRC